MSCGVPSVGADQLPAGQVSYKLHALQAQQLENSTTPYSRAPGCRQKPSGKQLPGPKFPVPLLGAVVEMVLDPFKFWEQQRKWVSSCAG